MLGRLAVSVSPGLSILIPRWASRVTLAVGAVAWDVIYLSTSLSGSAGTPAGTATPTRAPGPQ